MPDHSSLTRIRERFGLSIFRRFFERIVQECFEAGLVWGEELFFDATKVEASASIDSTRSRSLVEEHLAGTFPGDALPAPEEDRSETIAGVVGPEGESSRERTPIGTAGSPGPGARSGPWRGGATSGWRTSG